MTIHDVNKNGFTMLLMSAVLTVSVGIGGYTLNREYRRNDEQEARIQILERSQDKITVQLSYIGDNLAEVKRDVKKMLQKP